MHWGWGMIVFDQYVYPQRPDIGDDIVVFHSGFCSTVPNYSYGRDTRDYYLIHYCTGGKGVYRTGEQCYELSQNDGFLILPNQSIVHTADKSDPWNLCWVAFFGPKAEHYLRLAGLGEQQLLFRYDKDDFLERCIKNIYDESRAGKNIATITGHFLLMMGRMIDHFQSVETCPPVAGFSHFEDARNYILRNLHSRISVEELSGYLRLDPSQIYRIFKKSTGVSPQQYITGLRMEKACEMLEKTDLPIKDIAKWLNFEYQSHFTKQFKNYMGLAPSEFRQAGYMGLAGKGGK